MAFSIVFEQDILSVDDMDDAILEIFPGLFALVYTQKQNRSRFLGNYNDCNGYFYYDTK